MFSKPSGGKRPPGTDTIIGQATRLEGLLHCETDLHVEGQVNGDIHCLRDVIIGETGIVTSCIKANNLIVSGQLDGNVIVTGSCIIETTGRLTGEVESCAFIIREGGMFNGISRMAASSSASNKHKSKEADKEAAAASSE